MFNSMQDETHATIGNARYPRIPYTQERVWAQVHIPVPTWPCSDCGVLPGQRHGTRCCIESCPKCLDGIRISCDCASA